MQILVLDQNVPELAWYITGTGIKWYASTCNVLYPYWYWNVHKIDLKEVNT
jgi:hypothetical protein